MTVAEQLPRPASRTVNLATLGLLLAGVVILFGNVDVKKGDNGGTGPAIVTAAICVVLAAALFGYVLPRTRNAERTALILGVVAVVSIVAFWSGVTPVLAAAAIAVSPRTGSSSRRVTIVQALAAVAALATVVVTLAQTSVF